jgi:hypothetical protein
VAHRVEVVEKARTSNLLEAKENMYDTNNASTNRNTLINHSFQIYTAVFSFSPLLRDLERKEVSKRNVSLMMMFFFLALDLVSGN